MARDGSRTGGRAHSATPEQETERYAAAERLGELIERREELLSEVSQVEAAMKACEATVRSFD
jgi:hypothetical protein